jgi:hypothetical protein
MPEPQPERPRDAGVPESEPAELGQLEGASLLANDARARLRADGFDDNEIGIWADAFIAQRGSGSVDEFVEWIARQERPG